MIERNPSRFFHLPHVQARKNTGRSARAICQIDAFQNPKHGTPGAVSTFTPAQITSSNPVTKTVLRMASCRLMTNATIFFMALIINVLLV